MPEHGWLRGIYFWQFMSHKYPGSIFGQSRWSGSWAHTYWFIGCLLNLSSHDGRGEGAVWELYRQGTNSPGKGPCFHDPITSGRSHFLSPPHRCRGFQHMGRERIVQAVTLCDLVCFKVLFFSDKSVFSDCILRIATKMHAFKHGIKHRYF